MNANTRLIWQVLVHPRATVKGVAEHPPFGLCLAILTVTSLAQAFLTPTADRAGYPLWLWLVWVEAFTFALSFGLTFVTWVWVKLLRVPARYGALFCIGELSTLATLPSVPLYPLLKGSWAGFQTWNLLLLSMLVWTSLIFVWGLRACCESSLKKAAWSAVPALAVTWGLCLWSWFEAPPLEGAYPWTSRDRGRVRVHVPRRSQPAEVERITAGSEELLAKVARVLEVDPPEFKTGVFLFPSDRLHRKAVPSDWTDPAGFAHPEAISLVYAPWDRIRDTVAHEFAHVVSVHRIAPELGAQPLLCEGLAEYVRDAVSVPSGDAPDEDSLFVTTDTPLRTLSRFEVFYDEQSMDESGDSYPHAGSFVRYLISQYGMERFKRLCREATAGGLWAEPVEELEQAMQRVYSRSLVDLERAWRSEETSTWLHRPSKTARSEDRAVYRANEGN